jgi:hypothetical protein
MSSIADQIKPRSNHLRHPLSQALSLCGKRFYGCLNVIRIAF